MFQQVKSKMLIGPNGGSKVFPIHPGKKQKKNELKRCSGRKMWRCCKTKLHYWNLLSIFSVLSFVLRYIYIEIFQNHSKFNFYAQKIWPRVWLKSTCISIIIIIRQLQVSWSGLELDQLFCYLIRFWTRSDFCNYSVSELVHVSERVRFV